MTYLVHCKNMNLASAGLAPSPACLGFSTQADRRSGRQVVYSSLVGLQKYKCMNAFVNEVFGKLTWMMGMSGSPIRHPRYAYRDYCENHGDNADSGFNGDSHRVEYR